MLSPYEHPSEIAVANWVGALRGAPVYHIKIDAKLLHESWEKQAEAISSELEALNLEEEYVLILSDVCFATGAVIPVKLNPVPLIPTCEIVTLEPPVLVTVSDSD